MEGGELEGGELESGRAGELESWRAGELESGRVVPGPWLDADISLAAMTSSNIGASP
jgi:hypothetical protein